MAKNPEKGVVYTASRVSYISNYVLIVLAAVLFYLAYTTFNLTFTLLPRTIGEFFSFFVIFGFIILIVFLIEQPAFEQIVRQYIITQTEVVKIEGLLRKRRVLFPYSNISDVEFNKGILGRIFNFGDISIVGFKEKIVIKGIRNPEEAYRLIKHRIGTIARPPALQKQRLKTKE